MFGFRVLAIILGLICLATAIAMVSYDCPRLAPVPENFIEYFVRDAGVRAFIKSQEPTDIKIKNLIKYTLGGLAICLFGLGLLFFCAAVNPLRLRPFVSVVMICCAAGIAVAIGQGVSLRIFKSWWIGDAAGGLLILILLAALYPRKGRPAPAPAVGGSEAGLE